jgi:NAD(P)-dependent dehydrogenase (short-subunit alcohol dehydrogenase family)
MHVAVTDIDEVALAAVADEISALGVRALAVPTDVRDRKAMGALADRVHHELGPVRVLHNNAGVGLIEPLRSTTDEDWRWIMDVNYFGVVNGIQAFLPRMLETTGERHIVNTASVAGMHTSALLAGYNASKFAVVGLTEVMRTELAPEGIGVSMLCPGVVGTRIVGRSRKLRALQSRPPEPVIRTAQVGDWTELRVVPAEDVARVVVRGIRNNEFYLFADPEPKQLLLDRFNEILAAVDQAGTADD